MENSIKNTLFRFVTLRAPEIHKENDKDPIRIETPIGSYFINIMTSSDIKSEKERVGYLIKYAEEFESKTNFISSKTSLTSLVGQEIYLFSKWLKVNKNNVSEEELNRKLNDINSINENILLALWDNLFYQMITKSDTSLREEIYQFIFVTNLINNRNNDLYKDKIIELVKAKIIVPNFFSKIEVKNASNTDLPIKNFFKKEINLTYANTHLKEIESLERELVLIQKSYEKANAIFKKEYDNSFEIETKNAYAAATLIEKMYVDSETGNETKYFEYENLNLPEYNFIPIDELDFTSYYRGNLSQSLQDLQRDAFSEQYISTLDELKNLLKEDKEKVTEIIFKNVNLSYSNFVGDGGVLFKKTNVILASTNGIFNIFSTGAYNSKSLSIMLLGIPQELNVISADYKVTFPDNTFIQKSLFTQSMMSNSILKIDLFNTSNNYFNPGNDHMGFAIEATFNCSNNQKLTLNGNATINRTIYIDEIPGNGQTNPGFTPSPDFFSNIDEGWDTLNFSNLAPFKMITDIGYTSQGGSSNSNFNVTGNGTYQLTTLDIDGLTFESGSEEGQDEQIEKYGLKRLGIADYRRVEQEVCCYVPGEVSHIENIMAREFKERITKRLRRSEDTFTSIKEREIENLTDTTTTDRFEMNQEIYQMTSQQNALGVQGGLQWTSKGVGPSGFLHTDMSYSSSRENSNSQAVNYAKDVTARALERVVNKIKEERISKIIDEFSEENIHGFDNKKGDSHISGVYRWVDKIYENKIINYGKRLMYEFAIPEPAAFHRFAMDRKSLVETNLEEPKDPRKGDGIVRIQKPSDITETNYQHWAAIYNAEVEPCPASKITTGKSIRLMSSNGRGQKYFSINDSIDIPEGYSCTKAYSNAQMMFHLGAPEWPRVITTIGNVSKIIRCLPVAITQNSTWNGHYTDKGADVRASTAEEHNFSQPFYKSIPIGATAYDSEPEAHATFTIECNRTSQLFNQWQIDTFKAIISAYEEKLRKYNEKIEQLQSLQKDKATSNPLFYRDIENTMLKKSCIEYFLKNNQIGIEGLIIRNTDNVLVNYTKSGLGTYADRVKFLEQAFEWDIMSYRFYPFYWAEKSKWVEYYTTECDDPLFNSFLQSGMARVIVTVRPGFEAAVNWFLETGEVWNGEEAPTINDPLFQSIVHELEVIEGEVEDTWQSRVPTSLTVIQAGSIGLDVQGLPCNVDCSDFGFDSDGNSLNPIKHTNTKLGESDLPEQED